MSFGSRSVGGRKKNKPQRDTAAMRALQAHVFGSTYRPQLFFSSCDVRSTFWRFYCNNKLASSVVGGWVGVVVTL